MSSLQADHIRGRRSQSHMTTPIGCEFLRQSKDSFWIFECEIWLKNRRGVKSTTRVAIVALPLIATPYSLPIQISSQIRLQGYLHKGLDFWKGDLRFMSSLPRSINLVEVGPREGFQFEGIGDAGRISTGGKVRLVDALSETGLKNIQVISFVNPKAVPQVADAEEVAKRFKRKPGVVYTSVYMNVKGFERALNTGKLDMEGHIYLTASETFSKRNTNRTLEEELLAQRQVIQLHKVKGIPITGGSILTAFGCNFEGDISLQKVITRIKTILELAHEYDFSLKYLQLADTMGWANPAQIKRCVGEIQDSWPDLRVGLHLHDTRGTGLANVYAGLEMGVTDFDSSVGGLGGCPFAAHRGAAGNVCTEDIVFMCAEMGIETGVDLDIIIDCALLAENIVGHPLPGKIKKGGSLDKLRNKILNKGS